MRVLVVDDDVVVGMFLAMASSDFELVEAGGVGDAIRTVKQGPPIAAAIIDRRLPDGDGLEIVRAIRLYAPTRRVPIVVVTAADPDDRLAVLKAGADEYVGKPFEAAALIELVQRLSLLAPLERKPRRLRHIDALAAGRPSLGIADLPVLPPPEEVRRRRFLRR